MFFWSKLFIFLSMVFFFNGSLIAEDVPDVCPTMIRIQTEGLSHVVELMEGYYLAFNLSHYETPFHWVFIMSTMMAESEEAALQKSNQMLAILSGFPKPEQDNEGNWICEYETNHTDITAFAIQADDMLLPWAMSSKIDLAKVRVG